MSDPFAIINVTGLSYEYPGLRALDNVGFSVQPGSITALVGPNGAGKTTLLRCLAGLDRPLTGAITVNGVDVVEEPRRSHRNVGYLSDFFGLYEDLTVSRSLAYVAAANGVPPAELDQVVRRTADDTGLSTRLAQRTGALSRGLRQRVAIAQAIIHGPAVVLLDEPAAGLDPEARYALGELFIHLRERGMSLLVSSHILAELETYATDMLVLRAGRIIEHERLGATAADEATLRIDVANQADELLTLLTATSGVSGVTTTPLGARFRFAGTTDARATLLRTIIERGINVTQFALAENDLQQSYLRTITAAENHHES